MTRRFRPTRPRTFALTLGISALLALAGPAACRRQAGADHGQNLPANPYAPVQTIEMRQQDPAWKHKVAIVTIDTGNAMAASPSASQFDARRSNAGADGVNAWTQVASAAAGGAEAADLGAELERAGFTVTRLTAPPADGGEFNTVLEVGSYVDQKNPVGAAVQMDVQVVVYARVLAPTANGSYPSRAVTVSALSGTPGLAPPEVASYGQQLREAQRELFSSVVTSLSQVLQPTPPPPAADEPPPPDPKVQCRADCEAKREPCNRTCCEKELGSDVTKCDAARDAATRCESECVAKNQSETDEGIRGRKLEDCRDGCRRGKHSAYPWDTAIAKNASSWAKCTPTCETELQSCVSACDGPTAAPAAAATTGAMPAAPPQPPPAAPPMQ